MNAHTRNSATNGRPALVPLTSAIGTPLPVGGVPPGVLAGALPGVVVIGVGVGVGVAVVGVGVGRCGVASAWPLSAWAWAVVGVGVGVAVVGVGVAVVGVGVAVVGVGVVGVGVAVVGVGVGVQGGAQYGALGEAANVGAARAGCPATRTARMAADTTTSPPIRRLSDSMIAPVQKIALIYTERPSAALIRG